MVGGCGETAGAGNCVAVRVATKGSGQITHYGNNKCFFQRTRQ